MREPEAEEHHVVAPVRLPCEQVGLHEADAVVADLYAGDGEHLARGVERGHARGMAEQPRRPQARPARELEHVSRGRERVERGLDLRAALRVDDPVEVFRRSGVVIRHLFGQQRLDAIVGHRGTVPRGQRVALPRFNAGAGASRTAAGSTRSAPPGARRPAGGRPRGRSRGTGRRRPRPPRSPAALSGADRAMPVEPQPPAVGHGVGDLDVQDAGPLPVPPPPVGRVQAPQCPASHHFRRCSGTGPSISRLSPAPAMPIGPPGLTSRAR